MCFSRGAIAMSMSSSSGIPVPRRRCTRRRSSIAAKPGARWSRRRWKKCWRSPAHGIRSTAGTSTVRRPPTVTITARTAVAASRCWAAMCCRFASISPMSRLAMEWAAASRGCRATAICGARTAKSPRRIRISRCGVWVTPRRSLPFSMNCLPRGASVPNTGLADAVQLRAEMPLFTGPNWDFGSLRQVYEAVERVLDAAHALKEHGVNRYAHRSKPNLAEEQRRIEERRAHEEATYNDLWRTVPQLGGDKDDPVVSGKQREQLRQQLGLPEENLLYFIEKRAPRLEDWQRE